MLENRETMLQIFPELFAKNRVQRVSNYPQMLRQSLEACAPPQCEGKPVIAVLTPGIHNSAYFEHAFLADQMGAELIYRRVDDDYLDPLNFKPNSMLGIPGVMDIYRAGGITIANAPGAGIADDKAIYSYMPDIIRFYTGEKDDARRPYPRGHEKRFPCCQFQPRRRNQRHLGLGGLGRARKNSRQSFLDVSIFGAL